MKPRRSTARPRRARPRAEERLRGAGPSAACAGVDTLAQQVSKLAELEVEAPPQVGIVAQCKACSEQLQPTVEELNQRQIRYELRVIASPQELGQIVDYATNAKLRGLRVLIVATDLSLGLCGLVAAQTELPVIGLPLSSGGGGVGGKHAPLGGLAALLAAVQMPEGTPVACVGLDAARNAAILAAQILAATA